MANHKRKARARSDTEEARIQAGIAADPDNPEWTAQDFRRAKPFAQAFPALAESRRGRGPQKEPSKVAVSLRLTRKVVEHFKADGPGWQTRIDEALKKAAGALKTTVKISDPGIVRVIGFDSAWTDNKNSRGAICALVVGKDRATTFVPPQHASFDEALAFITTQRNAGGTCIVAIDQPTIVPNNAGCRPVDRVAGSVVSFIGGGVQPANRSKTGMFDNAAPIWRFKKQLNATENPEMSRTAKSGLFIVEVYPYLALAALNRKFWGRGSGPKYNPANKKFREHDWRAVIETITSYARTAGIDELETWLRHFAGNTSPRKPDQDRLDSVLCALVGYHWREKLRTDSVMIGDLTNGYMIAPTHTEARDRLASAARKHGTSID